MSARPGRRLALALATILACVPVVRDARASTMPDPPHILQRSDPALPDSLAALRLPGWVLVHVTVDSTGQVSEACVIDRRFGLYFFGPYERAFEDAAVAASRTYRFGSGVGETSPAGTFVISIPFTAPPDSLAPPTGSLAGRVTDSEGRWLSHVAICARSFRLATFILSGQYRVDGVPAGTHEIWISAQGYCPARRTVVVRSGVTDTLNLVLESCPGAALEGCREPQGRVVR